MLHVRTTTLDAVFFGVFFLFCFVFLFFVVFFLFFFFVISPDSIW